MRYVSTLFPRSVRSLSRRLRQSRPGSVLILCVALLVLLALIGTAMISTTRVDRYSAVQHTNNTEVDLLVEGVKAISESAVVTDLWDSNTSSGIPRYRPGNSSGTSTYDHWDCPIPVGAATAGPQLDAWLASRYPQPRDIYKTAAVGTANNPIIWRAITGPLCAPNG